MSQCVCGEWSLNVHGKMEQAKSGRERGRGSPSCVWLCMQLSTMCECEQGEWSQTLMENSSCVQCVGMRGDWSLCLFLTGKGEVLCSV